jgi:hypothetical protein
MTKRLMPAAAGVVLSLSLGVSCGVRAGNVVLIPAGFKGWVILRYGLSAEPALEHEGVKTLVKVPGSGSLSTSSDRSNGYGIDDYYFVGPDGNRAKISSDTDGCKEQEPCVQQFEFVTSPAKTTIFFVGQRQDLPRYPKPKVP